MKNKKYLWITFAFAFCSLTAYAATGSIAEAGNHYRLASSSNADSNQTAENTLPESDLDMDLIAGDATPSDATPSDATLLNGDTFLALSETEDYYGIKSLEDDMLDRAEHLYEMGEINRPLSSSDIDYKKAVKIFMDGKDSITELPTISKSELSNYLDGLEYIWELPINIGTQTISFTFNIGKPLDDSLADLLTEEQQEEIASNEGNWIIARAAWNDAKVDDYKTYVANIFEENSLDKSETTSVLIGGIPDVYQPVAITLTGNATYVLPSCKAADRSITNLAQSNSAKEGRKYSTSKVLSYDDFKELLNR